MSFPKYGVTANRLITKWGRDVTFKKMSSTAADSSQPWRGTEATLTTTVQKAVFVGLQEVPPLFANRMVTHELVNRIRKVLLVAPNDDTLDLAEYDSVQDGDSDWKINFVETLAPGAETLRLLYFIGVYR